MKILFALALLAIVGAMVAAGVAMIRDGRGGRPKTHAMWNALAWRVGISVALFLCILLAYKLGWIQPTGVPQG